MKRFPIPLLLALMLHQCKETGDWIENLRKASVKKRYGIDLEQKIPDWEKNIAEYKTVIEDKVEAGIKLASVYRKLGEAYGAQGAYELCIKNMKLAIEHGYREASAFHSLGLCQGALARSWGWKPELTEEAEKSFLAALSADKNFHKSKFELALIYFYGYGKNHEYSVLHDRVTVEQNTFRTRAVTLLREYQFQQPNDKNSYFALASMYSLMNDKKAAADQMQNLLALLQKHFPDKYTKLPEYADIRNNLKQLGVNPD